MSAFALQGDGRVALVTGGASGIGRAVTEVFAEAGYRLVLADLDGETGRSACEALAARGFEAHFTPCDVASEPQVAAAVQAARDRWQRLDFVFNSAGILGPAAPIERLDGEDLERVLAVDLKGVFFACKHAVAAMRGGGGGSILNVASITAGTGSAFYAPYSAAKAGVIALTRSLARRVGRYNIRINCLSPGSIVDTNIMNDYYIKNPDARSADALSLMRKIPLGRPGRPRDVAHLALFLASPFASHLHGTVLTIDGGESLGYQ